jgi:hypothetical protein
LSSEINKVTDWFRNLVLTSAAVAFISVAIFALLEDDMARPRPARVVGLFLLLAFPLVATAQQASVQPITPPVRDAQAMAILTSALAAMGSQSAATIQDTVVQGTTTFPESQGGNTGSFTITTKGAQMLRSDSQANGKSSSIIYNQGVERRSTNSGWHNAPSANALHKRIEHLPALLLAYEVARNDVSAQYIAQETVNGRSVNHLRLIRVPLQNDYIAQQNSKNSQLDLFVDAQTSQILKISYFQSSDTDWRLGLHIDVIYSEYQTNNGMAVPMLQQYFFQGQPAATLQITSVAVNQGVSISTFQGN